MSFLGLVCLGLCLGELSIYFLVGGRRVGQGVLQFGRWCLYAFFSVFEDLENSMENIVASFLHLLYLCHLVY
jgi:hypothetical protein